MCNLFNGSPESLVGLDLILDGLAGVQNRGMILFTHNLSDHGK